MCVECRVAEVRLDAVGALVRAAIIVMLRTTAFSAFATYAAIITALIEIAQSIFVLLVSG